MGLLCYVGLILQAIVAGWRPGNEAMGLIARVIHSGGG